MGLVEGLDFDVEDLAAPVHPIGRVDPMRSEKCAVGRIFGKLGGLKAVGPATLAASLFGMFSFRCGHGSFLRLKIMKLASVGPARARLNLEKRPILRSQYPSSS